MVTTAVTQATSDTTASAAMKQSIGLNKDDFLKLFISQLKYQDPLKPQDPSAMLDQLSQLSLVEQSYNNNAALEKLLNAQNSNTTMNSVSFIGKTVTSNGNSVPFDGTTPAQLQFSFTLPVNSGSVTIRDASGNVVRSMPLSATPSGNTSIQWEGQDAQGNLLPAGSYSFSVSGIQGDGSPLSASTYTTGKVDGVSLANGNAVLTIGKTSIALADVISIKGV